MDKRYEVYALSDGHFYDTPERLSAPGEQAAREVPEGREAARVGDWLTLTTLDADESPVSGPAQGWCLRGAKVAVGARRSPCGRDAARPSRRRAGPSTADRNRA